MKKKKQIITVIGAISLCICIVICVLIVKINNENKTINGLLKNLERAINSSDKNSIIRCYPDFIQNSLPTLSDKLIKEFHEKVGNISFDIIKQNSIELKDKENEINLKYNCNIKLQEYDLVTCKYHDEFCEDVFEMIKINGRWYLYYYSHFPEPIQYFVE